MRHEKVTTILSLLKFGSQTCSKMLPWHFYPINLIGCSHDSKFFLQLLHAIFPIILMIINGLSRLTLLPCVEAKPTEIWFNSFGAHFARLANGPVKSASYQTNFFASDSARFLHGCITFRNLEAAHDGINFVWSCSRLAPYISFRSVINLKSLMGLNWLTWVRKMISRRH